MKKIIIANIFAVLLIIIFILSGCGGGNPAASGSGATIPAVPAGLTITPASGQNTISWTAVAGATSYNIYGGTTTGAAVKGGTLIINTNTNSYAQTGLSNGTAYYYVVTAVNGAGESGASTVASGTPVSPALPPSSPTGVTATSVSWSQIDVNWSLSAGVNYYNIYRSNVPGFTISPALLIASGAAGPFGNTGLPANTTYYYKITAVNAIGESLPSTEVMATTQPLPAIPAAPTGVTATSTGSTSVNIAWTNVTGATSYKIYGGTTTVAAVKGGTFVGTASSGSGFIIGNLTTATTYYYVVTAVNAGGESAASVMVSATPTAPVLAPAPRTIIGSLLDGSLTLKWINPAIGALTAPPAPTSLTTTVTGGTIVLNWAQPATGKIIMSYNIYRSTSPNVALTTANLYNSVFMPAPLTFTDTGAVTGVTYYYVVTVLGTSGESGGSNEANATVIAGGAAPPPPPAVSPNAPTGLTATVANPGEIDLSWNPVAGATGYNIYAATGANGVVQNATFLITSTPITGTGAAHFRLTAGTTYSYIVTSIVAGVEYPTAIVNCTIPLGTSPTLTIAAIAKTYADPYGYIYYQDTVGITAPAGAYTVKVYYSDTPGGPYTLGNIPYIPYVGATYNLTGNYVTFMLDANGAWAAVALSGMAVHKYVVMTTVDGTGKESAFSNEIWYHW